MDFSISCLDNWKTTIVMTQFEIPFDISLVPQAHFYFHDIDVFVIIIGFCIIIIIPNSVTFLYLPVGHQYICHLLQIGVAVGATDTSKFVLKPTCGIVNKYLVAMQPLVLPQGITC